jgi:hypothetical protein
MTDVIEKVVRTVRAGARLPAELWGAQEPGIRPLGGPLWKNLAAWAVISGGSMLEQNQLGLEHRNSLVPPAPGTDPTNYNDSFVFEGSGRGGELVMTRIGLRDGSRWAEVWLWLVVDGVKYWLPRAEVELDGRSLRPIEAGGLRYQCTDDARDRWRLTGAVELEPEGVPCELDLEFTPRSACYHSGVHMNAAGFARAMAEMPWSRRYFDKLRSENQCRIEQGGWLTGAVTLGGRRRPLELLCIRDHSWGKRDWTFINRYIWNVVSLEQDLVVGPHRFRDLVCSTVDYGSTFEHLVTGWIAGEDEVVPIVAASDMASIGGSGTIPAEFTVRFCPQGCPSFEMQLRRSQPEHSWFTQSGGFEICEAHCSVDIEGAPGYGMSEFGYRVVDGERRGSR